MSMRNSLKKNVNTKMSDIKIGWVCLNTTCYDLSFMLNYDDILQTSNSYTM